MQLNNLVKYGSNGKALYNDFKPYTGPNYIEMMEAFNAALANLDAASIEYGYDSPLGFVLSIEAW